MAKVAGLDGNSRPTIITASNANGTDIVPIYIHMSDHGLKMQDASGQTDNGNNGGNAMLDENSRPVWIGLSSANDGAIVEVYGDPATNSILMIAV